MSSLEARQELSLDFIKVAEQAAMDKVMDIHKEKTSKHCFVRFGHLVIDSQNEETANQDVDRLEGVLRYGLVAENFAKRIGIPFSRNWSDQINEKCVSLFYYNNTLGNAFHVGAFAALHTAPKQTQIPREDIYTILIKEGHYTSYPKGAQNRIAPRFFMGIVIFDDIREKLFHIYDDGINFESATSEESAGKVIEKMQSVYKDKPSLCIPIYGLSGDLYWPKKMSYQEVQSFVSSRNR